MKKALTTFLICLITVVCFAGTGDDKDKGRDLPNGFRLGYQWSNLISGSETAASNLNGFYAGFTRKFFSVPLVHLETGLEYMMAGAKQSDNTKLQLHYLVLPFQGVLKIGPFIGLAGINGDFRLAEKLTVNGETVKRDKADRSSVFDVAADAGVGFNIAILTIEARYYWGLIEVDNGWYNRYWQAGLKLHF